MFVSETGMWVIDELHCWLTLCLLRQFSPKNLARITLLFFSHVHTCMFVALFITPSIQLGEIGDQLTDYAPQVQFSVRHHLIFHQFYFRTVLGKCLCAFCLFDRIFLLVYEKLAFSLGCLFRF